MRKIKIIVVAFVTFFCVTGVHASTTTYERTSDNLGVNKKWEINETNISNVYRTPLVDATEKIYDFADIFTEEEEMELYKRAQAYIANTNMDIVVLTTTLKLSDYGLEEYAADFYDYNDFGIDFEHYSGAILIINMDSYNRFYNIYTFGNSIIYFNDYRLEATLDNIYSNMVNENYTQATVDYITTLNNYYLEGIPSGNVSAYINEFGNIVYPKPKYSVPWVIILIVSIIVSIVITLVLLSRNKMVKKATHAKEYLDKNATKYTNNQDIFLRSRTSSIRIVSDSGSGGSHGGSSTHSGSSGGFHGGGSGRHF